MASLYEKKMLSVCGFEGIFKKDRVTGLFFIFHPIFDCSMVKYSIGKQKVAGATIKMEKNENFGEELFNLLVRVLNSPANREVFDSIRGEYGLLWILLNADGPVTVGQLSEELQVVPGRMTDILKQLEKKGMITRTRSMSDRRVVEVSLLDAGREEVIRRRAHIKEKFGGINQCFSDEEEKELLRLLNMLLTYQK